MTVVVDGDALVLHGNFLISRCVIPLMLTELHKHCYSFSYFVPHSIHVCTGREVDMLIRTAVYHVNVFGLNKYIGLACEVKGKNSNGNTT